MTNKTELLPCPFCGGEADRASDGYVVCFNSSCPIHCVIIERDAWNTRAAPAEDVRAMVDEPVAEVVTIRKQSLPMLIAGKYQPSISSDEKVAMFDIDLPNGTKLYRHPQRPVVMPERKPAPYKASVGLIPYHEGWNACLDEIERLNREQS